MSTPDVTAIAPGPAARLTLPGLSVTGRRRAGHAALGLLLGASLTFALGTASGPSTEVPASKFGWSGWLGGPLPDVGLQMTSSRFLTLITVMALCHVVMVVFSDALSARWALGGVAVAHLIYVLAPPVLSPDVFGYLGYARMGTLYGLNPYVQSPLALISDPIYTWVRWRVQIDPYGPLFTLLSYPLGLLSVAAGLWTVKVATGLISIGLVALVWACARRLGVTPLGPTVFVGLNPFLLLYGVGGAHNDLLMMALVMGALLLVLERREGLGGGVLASAMAVKASAGLLLPFFVLGSHHRGRAVVGAAAVAAVLAGVAFAVFGTEGVAGMLHGLSTQSVKISSHNVPNGLGWAFGFGGVSPGVRIVATSILLISVVVLLVLVWRGTDWITGMGWATLALLVTTTWLMHWYLVWLLPLAALGRSRTLRVATLALPAVMVLTGLPPVPK